MTASRRSVLVCALLAFALPPKDSWFGADKVKHFLMSALIQSTAFSIVRATGAHRSAAMVAGAASAVTVGVLKEVRDKQVGKPFSFRDLVWDGAGAASAAALLNRSR